MEDHENTPTLLQLALALIETEGNTQTRVRLDSATVDRYAGDMAAGDLPKFPPIVVFYDGERYWLADGFHRVAAAKATDGIRAITAEVRTGGREEAWLYACQANRTHGLQRNKADVKAIITALLRHPVHGQLSSRKLAELVNGDSGDQQTTHTTVLRYRRELFPAVTDGDGVIEAYTAEEDGTDEAGFPLGLTWEEKRALIGRVIDVEVLRGWLESKAALSYYVEDQLEKLEAIAAAKHPADLQGLREKALGERWPSRVDSVAVETAFIRRLAEMADARADDRAHLSIVKYTDAAGALRLSALEASETPSEPWMVACRWPELAHATRRHVLACWADLERVESKKHGWDLQNLRNDKLMPGATALLKTRLKKAKEKQAKEKAKRDWLSKARDADIEAARKLLAKQADKAQVRRWWKLEESVFGDGDCADERRARAPVRGLLRNHLETAQGFQLEFCASCEDTAMQVGKACPRCRTTAEARRAKEAEKAAEWVDDISEIAGLAAQHTDPDELAATMEGVLSEVMGRPVRLVSEAEQRSTPAGVSHAETSPVSGEKGAVAHSEADAPEVVHPELASVAEALEAAGAPDLDDDGQPLSLTGKVLWLKAVLETAEEAEGELHEEDLKVRTALKGVLGKRAGGSTLELVGQLIEKNRKLDTGLKAVVAERDALKASPAVGVQADAVVMQMAERGAAYDAALDEEGVPTEDDDARLSPAARIAWLAREADDATSRALALQARINQHDADLAQVLEALDAAGVPTHDGQRPLSLLARVSPVLGRYIQQDSALRTLQRTVAELTAADVALSTCLDELGAPALGEDSEDLTHAQRLERLVMELHDVHEVPAAAPWFARLGWSKLLGILAEPNIEGVSLTLHPAVHLRVAHQGTQSARTPAELEDLLVRVTGPEA